METVYVNTLENATLHIAKGNSKIGKGIYAFSTLCGNEEHTLMLRGQQLSNVVGTCSHHCETCFNGCYAARAAVRHHNAVIQAWADNTLLLRSGKAYKCIVDYIKLKQKTKSPIKVFRINVSGEILSEKDIIMWNKIALKFPEIKFGVYTKNFSAVEKFMNAYKTTAQNFAINISAWHGIEKEIIEKYPNQFNIFEYDDSNLKSNNLTEDEKTRLASLTHCPAVDIHGHHTTDSEGNPITCDRCLRCYNKTGKRTAVYAH